MKLALRDYLLKNHPEDTERLNFNMFREIGETLSATAHAQLRVLTPAATTTTSGKDWMMTTATSDHLERNGQSVTWAGQLPDVDSI